MNLRGQGRNRDIGDPVLGDGIGGGRACTDRYADRPCRGRECAFGVTGSIVAMEKDAVARSREQQRSLEEPGHSSGFRRDVSRPVEIDGLEVIDRLRSRRDVAGCLVLLEDGRYAVVGPVMALGSRQALNDWVRRRMRSGVSDNERVWWEEVLGAIAL